MPETERRPLPCPECGSTKGFIDAGPFRVHCTNCNSTVKREEVDLPFSQEEQTNT